VYSSSADQTQEAIRTLSNREKYRQGQEELKILNATLVNCSTAVFRRRLDVLQKLNAYWSSCEDVEIVLRSGDVSVVYAQENDCMQSELAENKQDGSGSQDESTDTCTLPQSVCTELSQAACLDALQPSNDICDAQKGLCPSKYIDVMPQNECLDALPQAKTNRIPRGLSQSVEGTHANLDGTSLPPPVKCRGRPKGIAQTVVGKRKHKQGKASHKGHNKKRCKEA